MVDKMKGLIYKTLKKSERFTQTDMIYVARGGFWLTLGHLVSSGSAFLLAIAFANLLPKEVFGTYKFIISISSILLVFSLGGMNSAMSQAVSRGFDGSVKKITRLKVRWGLLGGLSSLILAIYYYINANLELSTSFALVAIFLPFVESFNHYEGYLMGKKLFQRHITYYISSRLISVISLISAIFLSDNLFIILLAYFLPWTATRFFFYLLTMKKVAPNIKEDSSTISYGKHLSILGIVGRIGNYLDNILLFHYLGPVNVSIYTFSIAPVEQIRAVYKNIPMLAVPKLSNRSLEEIDSLLYIRLFKLLLLGILIGGVYVFIAPFFFKIFFPQYLEAIFFSQLLSVLLVIRLPFSFLSSVVQSKLDITPKNWLYWRQIGVLIQIISLFILVPMFGIIGVILSRVIFQLSSIAVNITHWKMLLKRNVSKLN